MKLSLFGIGNCNSTEYTSIKKELKSINKSIKQIRQDSKGGPRCRQLPGARLNKMEDVIGRAIKLQGAIDELKDEKHARKLINSSSYSKVNEGLKYITAEKNKIEGRSGPIVREVRPAPQKQEWADL
ncbi:hypothetical protein IG557_18695 [Vibrio cholerae]|uniref:hypothetical protein n=1 Tax=Vibrio cholerae TaxID=666 RepID=UPI0022716464|nr:hypothetical protein [Vibrio cholerae]MCX9560852.1 hypothetical protein [Vibrio cholerae]MCX9564648.1 hypothetical protein [Vibrio cholerae]